MTVRVCPVAQYTSLQPVNLHGNPRFIGSVMLSSDFDFFVSLTVLPNTSDIIGF